MAMIRDASSVRRKLCMLVFGAQGTGKSRYTMQLAYLKNPDTGKDFRVLYLDTETGSIDDYTDELYENGVKPGNVQIVYTQSLAEVQDFIRIVTNDDDFEDENGNVILDAYGDPFRADAIAVDSATILNTTAKQGLTVFSQKRAKVKATAQGLIGDEKAVKIEGAGMELKDYQTLNFRGQSLILDLNASGANYIVICREKDEKVTKIVDGKSVSEFTGKKIPDGFSGMEYNVKTQIRLYHPIDDDSVTLGKFIKDRSGLHRNGDIVEDPMLLEYQSIIDKGAKNKELKVKNGLNDAVSTEVKLSMRDLGIDDEPDNETVGKNANGTSEPTADSIKAKLNGMISTASPIKKNNALKALKAAGLSSAFRSMTDVEELKKIAVVMEKELA